MPVYIAATELNWPEQFSSVQSRFALCYGNVVPSVCNVGVLWPNGWMDQYTT